MNFSSTYRFVSLLLSATILLGISLPAGLHAASHAECDASESMPADHHISMLSTMMEGEGHHDCPMEATHSSNDSHMSMTDDESVDSGITCTCSIEKAEVSTEAPVFKKMKLQVLPVVQVLAENHKPDNEFDNYSTQISTTFSLPPIFLINESFLI